MQQKQNQKEGVAEIKFSLKKKEQKNKSTFIFKGARKKKYIS